MSGLQGIEFVESIYSMYLEREVDEQIIDVEIKQWLKLLVQVVDIAGPKCKNQVELLLSSSRSITEKYWKFLKECVSTTVL